jgi:DNA-binding MarR family transcriptional regulator
MFPVPSSKLESKGRGKAGSIDSVVHSPARLKILTVLKEVESADFLFILQQTGLTRGNLSSHLSKLEAVKYVNITKEFLGKLPHTVIRLTPKGRKALETYRQKMQELLDRLG